MTAGDAYQLVITPPAARALSDQLPEPVAAAAIELVTGALLTESVLRTAKKWTRV